jgi:PEGA domain-containing protein
MRRAVAVTLALLLAAPRALAQDQAPPPAPAAPAKEPTPAERAESRELFRAGARAYDAGKFGTAVRAFDQAYELAPHPALRFSAAQALRRQYAEEPRAELLRKAQSYYEQYLRDVGQGGRRVEAAQALGEIQVLLASATGAEPPPPSGEATALVASNGTLNLDASVKGATAEVDGRKVEKLPEWLEMKPGTYHVVIRAPGYHPFERQTKVQPGRITAVYGALEEQPARVTLLAAESGAEVILDDRPVGRTPLGRPLELHSGKHQLVVGTLGYDVHVEDLDLGRGEERTVEVDLGMTKQRIAAWTVLSLAGAFAGVGVGLIAAGQNNQAEARKIADIPADEQRPLTVEEADAYQDHLSSRDNYRRFATGAFALAAVGLGAGLLLFQLDEPDLYAVDSPPPDDTRPAAEPKEKTQPDLELQGSVAPLVGPDRGAVLWLRGRF